MSDAYDDIEPPLHVPDYRYGDPRKAELVGPLVRFRGGQQLPVPHAPPSDTTDPRYRACTDHHLACDCREGDLAEMLNEYRHELSIIKSCLQAAIHGHPTQVYVDSARRADLECQCTGCDLTRRLHLVEFANKRRVTTDLF